MLNNLAPIIITPNQQIKMISEESCDTEEWSNKDSRE